MIPITLPLTQGYSARLSSTGYERVTPLGRVSDHKWHVIRAKHGTYAATKIDGKTIYLHVFIMQPQTGEIVDHIDGDGLNCMPDNLRICTHSQNSANSKMYRNNKTGYRGIYYQSGSWWAKVVCNKVAHVKRGQRCEAGGKSGVICGADGPFARLNFPQGA